MVEAVIIQRSILKELLANFLIVMLFLSFVLFMEKFVRLSKLIMGKGADFIDIAKVFLYLQPSIFLLAVPIAILIAVFLTYGRMSTDNELIVLKGSGMSFWSISGPAIILSMAGFLLLLLISTYVLPKSILAFKKTLYETIVKKASVTINEETFSRVFKGTVIYIKEMESEDRFRGIFVYRKGDTKEPLIIIAEEGAIHANPEEGALKLSMRNGVVHTFGEKSSSEAKFADYDFVLTTVIKPQKELKPAERGMLELWKGRQRGVKWMVELNRRLAIPFACLIFGFLGPAFCTRIGKTGRLGGFSFSLSILIFYYVLLIMGESLAKAQRIPPFWGGWIPNIIFGSLAVIFFYMASKDRPIIRKNFWAIRKKK
jgi:lipopolysaccharide export system permease protein